MFNACLVTVRRTLWLCAIAAMFALGTHTATRAADVARDRGEQVRERLVIAGRQRMLAEALAAKLCYSEMNITPADMRSDAYVMWNIFGWYHQGIRTGNRELELGPESNRDVLLAWASVDTAWKPLKDIYRPVLSGDGVSAPEFERAMKLTGDVSQRATDLVARIRDAYADELGPRGFGSALLIDLYERQRMLGERIQKGVCLTARGDADAAELEDLTRTIEIFSASLEAFQNGREDVGVPSPPTPQIAGNLSDALSHWRPVAAFAYASAIGQQLGKQELSEFADAMELFIVNMTAAINGLVSHQNKMKG